MIDSHTHLDACGPEDSELVAAAVAAGVTRLVTIGTDGDSARAALAASDSFPQVYAAVGRHPHNAEGFDREDLDELRALSDHERCVAIGETGLDFYRENAPPADQERAFVAQLELAREVGKPVVIHTRSAEEDTMRLLAEHGRDVAVIMHCFSMPGRLEECLERGYWISLAGNVTYPSASDLANAATRVPAERLLVETDAPYLTPVPHRGERNEPANVVHTASFLAERRGVTLSELAGAVERNAASVFGW